MSGWAKNTLAALGGLIAGWILLEIGLATLGDVQRDFAPAKATLSLAEGLQALCYQPGATTAMPLDMRRPADRDWLTTRVQDWRVGHRAKWPLDSVLERFPGCVAFSAGRGSRGTAPDSQDTLLILGDSFAFGEGLQQADTVQDALGRLVPDNVVSYATRGADVAEVQRQFQAAVDAGVLDSPGRRTVVYLYNLNDLALPEMDQSGRRESSEEHLHALDDSDHLMERWGPQDGLERVLAWSRVWWWQRQRVASQWVSDQTATVYRRLYRDPAAEQSRERTRHLLRALDAQAKGRGAALLVVIYPLLVLDGEGQYPFAAENDLILDWCKQDGLRCENATDAIFAAPDVESLILHPHDRHPNGTANGLMAQFLATRFHSASP